MKKVLIAILALITIAGGIGTVYFYIQYREAASEKEVLIQQNAVLQNSIDAIGPITQVWTVKVDVFAGKVINEEATFCMFCGKKNDIKVDKAICSKCGKKLAVGSNFCHYCGANAKG